jgi:hypothetical protein
MRPSWGGLRFRLESHPTPVLKLTHDGLYSTKKITSNPLNIIVHIEYVRVDIEIRYAAYRLTGIERSFIPHPDYAYGRYKQLRIWYYFLFS